MMKRKCTLTVMLLVCGLNLMAQQTMFQKKFGGVTLANATVAEQASDSGFIIAGTTLTGYHKYFLIKTDKASNVVFSKTYGGSTDHYDLYDAVQTTDGGYMLAGFSNVSSNYNMYFIKTDANGDTLYTRSFGGYGGEIANSIIQTSDGGYLAAGSSSDNSPNTNLLLYKMDAAGDSMWSTMLSVPVTASLEVARDVKQTADGGYIIAGEYNLGQFIRNTYLIKVNSMGTVIWNKTYQVTGADIVASVEITSDGGYIIGGNAVMAGGVNNNIFLIRTNDIGDTLWTRTYGGIGLDYGGNAYQTTDGGFIVGGYTESYGAGQGDAYLIKTDANGVLSWSKTYGGNQYDQFNALCKTFDGGFFGTGIAGSFGSGYIYGVKTDSLGNSNCSQNAAATVTYHTPVPEGTTALANYLPGSFLANVVTVQGLLDSVTNTVCIVIAGVNETENNTIQLSVYPNPTTTTMLTVNFTSESNENIDFNITDVTGKTVFTQSLKTTKGITHSIIDVSKFAKGIYILNAKTKQLSGNTKISIQ